MGSDDTGATRTVLSVLMLVLSCNSPRLKKGSDVVGSYTLISTPSRKALKRKQECGFSEARRSEFPTLRPPLLSADVLTHPASAPWYIFPA